MAKRLRFLLRAEASETDGKTTIINVKNMQIEDSDEIYLFPVELQALSVYHKVLSENAVIQKAKKSLIKRHSKKNPYVILSEELRDIYLDAAGNPQFNGELLDELEFEAANSATKSNIAEVPTHPPAEQKKSLSSIAKDIILDSFNGANRNPLTWIDTFETECIRMEVPTSRRCEILRLFLEGSASEWYTTNRTLLGTATWETWRISFLNTFSCRGWRQVCDAIYFRYKSGSLNEYVIKKISLLVDMDPKLSDNAKICITVAGLPYDVREKLDKGEIDTVDRLLTKINLLDRPSKSNNNSNGGNNNNNPNYNRKARPNFTFTKRSPTPCFYCEKKGFTGRMHFESDCFYKQNDNKKNTTYKPNTANYSNPTQGTYKNNINSNTTRMVNATELEEILGQDKEQKN